MMIEIEVKLRHSIMLMLESDIPHKEKVIKYNKFVDFILDLIQEAKKILEASL